MPLEPGSSLGQYTILAQLGRGGMATVYRAMQTSLNRPVAIKVLPEFFATEPGFRARFQQEAVAIAQFRHANILSVYEYGEENGVDYIVTELADGGTLADRLGQPLAVADVVKLLTPIASAVDYAHDHGVIHRDIKPSNILFTADGTPVLADFGMARTASLLPRFTSTGAVIGTPEYMAPEQAAGEDATAASDLYALATIAYEMLTGKPPYSGSTPLSVLLAHLNTPLPPPREINAEIPPPIDAVVVKALAKQPLDRYESAVAFVNALAAASQTAAPPAAAGEPAVPVRERPARPLRASTTPEEAAPAAEPKTPAKPAAPLGSADQAAAGAETPPAQAGSRRRLMIVAGAIGAIVVVVVAVIALSGGGSSKSNAAFAAQQPSPTAAAAAAPVATTSPATPAPVAPTAVPTIDNRPPAPGTIYEDDFSEPARSAFSGSRGNSFNFNGIEFDRQIQDGTLQVKLTKGPAGRSFLTPGDKIAANSPLAIKATNPVAVDFDVRATGKAAQADYGLGLNADAGLRVHILAGTGTAVINTVTGDKITPVARTTNPAIATGEGTNHIRLEVRGNTASLTINGANIGTYADPSLAQRPLTVLLITGIEGAPVVATDNLRIIFDNFKLATIN